MIVVLAFALATLPPSVHPWPIGAGPRYHPPAAPTAIRAARPVASYRCGPDATRFRVHLELFANRRAVVVPAGIGVAAPYVQDGGDVRPAWLRLRAAHDGADGRRRGGRARRDGRRPVPRLGPAARRAPAALVRVRSARVRVFVGGSERSRRSAADPPDAARADRARDRRLRPAASVLPLPERSAVSDRRARRARDRRWRLPRGLRRLVEAELPARSAPRARTSSSQFTPAGPVQAGRPVTVSFTIRQPDGTPLTRFKRGPGPHTGVHLIIVRRDLAEIIHRHPPIAADGVASAADRVHASPARTASSIDAYPGDARPAAELPALRLAPRRGRLPPAAAAAVREHASRSTATASRCTARRGCTRSRRATSRSRSPTRRAVRRTSRPGSARSRTRSSSARARSTTSTRTSARPGATGCTSALGGTKVTGHLVDAGEAHRRRARARARHLAPVPPVQGRRPRPHRAVHARPSTD